MKKIRIAAGILISIIFLVLVFRKIDFSEVLAAMTNISMIWLPAAIIIYFLGIFIRTFRWGILMKPIKACSVRSLFPVYIISYMANNILPLRIGDLYRAYIIGKKESISKSASLVTVGVERIFDGLTMLLLLAVSLMFYPVSNPLVRQAIRLGSMLFLGAIAACYVIIVSKSLTQRLSTWLVSLVSDKYKDRASQVITNLLSGLDSLKGIRMIALIISGSLITWLLEAASYYLTLMAFGYRGDFHVAVATMAMVNLLIIVPSAPGYFGPFELACVILLGKSGYGNLTQFSDEMAAAFALVLHVAIQWIPSTLLGLFYMWKEHVSFKEIHSGDDPRGFNEKKQSPASTEKEET